MHLCKCISVNPYIHTSIVSNHPVCLHVFCISEKEWRDKQKSVDTLKETIERQKKDLDKLRKDIGDKEMLCSVLRVCLFQLYCFYIC